MQYATVPATLLLTLSLACLPACTSSTVDSVPGTGDGGGAGAQDTGVDAADSGGATTASDAPADVEEDGGQEPPDTGADLAADTLTPIEDTGSPPDTGGPVDSGPVDSGGGVDTGVPTDVVPDGPGGVPCSVSGVSGECLHVDDCTGDRHSTPGFCPGPAEIQCCTPNDSTGGACDPDAHPTPNAGLTEPAGLGGCPAGMALVADFCIDRYEAFLVEVTGGGTAPWSPFFNPDERRIRAMSAAGAVPQAYISRDQAEDACAEAGKRLCSDDEWLLACQGPAPPRTFPYGDTREWGRCNDSRDIHPAVEYFGTAESWVFSELDHPCLNQLPDSLAESGANAGCVTPESVFDLVGNLHEWTSGTPSPGHGVFRGGFYVDTVVNGEGCYYRTTAHAPSYWDYSTGFRCCADL